MDTFLNLRDKRILITGASKGIGKELSIFLDACGCQLILHASSELSLAPLRDTLKNKNHIFWQSDFSDVSKLSEEISSLSLSSKKLDGFVHCVGVRSRRPLNMLKFEHVQHVMNVNYFSFIELVRLLSKKENYNSGMSIVTMSSVSSLSGGASVTAYAASKAAIDAAIRCLSKELYSKTIRLNSIIAGQVLTEAYVELMETKTTTEDKVMERQYLGAVSTSDVVNAIVFLLSDRSKMITGKSIPVDGGYLT